MSSIPLSKAPARSDSDRLETALDLAEAGIAMRRAQLEREHPDASVEEIDARLLAWLRERPGAPGGDAEGRAAPDRFADA